MTISTNFEQTARFSRSEKLFFMTRYFLLAALFLLLAAPAVAQQHARQAQGMGRASAPSLSPQYGGASGNQDRCLRGDDLHCQKSMEIELARQIQNLERNDRARLGNDFCLVYREHPQCKAKERREDQRSSREFDSYCSKNPDAPRCVGLGLNHSTRSFGSSAERSSSSFVASPSAAKAGANSREKDDFFAFPEPPPSDDTLE